MFVKILGWPGEGATSEQRFKHIKTWLFSLATLVPIRFQFSWRWRGCSYFSGEGGGTPKIGLAQKSTQDLWAAGTRWLPKACLSSNRGIAIQANILLSFSLINGRRHLRKQRLHRPYFLTITIWCNLRWINPSTLRYAIEPLSTGSHFEECYIKPQINPTLRTRHSLTLRIRCKFPFVVGRRSDEIYFLVRAARPGLFVQLT